MHFAAWHLRGLIALQGGDYERGIGFIQRSLQLSPQQASAHSNLGNGLLSLRRPEAALRSFHEALRLNGAFAPAWHNRGNALRSLGRFEEALSSYDHALRINANDPLVHYNRGNLLLDLNRVSEALVSLAAALRLSPGFLDARVRQVAALLAVGRHDEALAGSEALLQQLPGDPRAHVTRGNVLLKLRRYDEAYSSFDLALQLDSNDLKAILGRGESAMRLLRLEEALPDFERALELAPESALALNHYGNALVGLRRIDEALRVYDRALQLQPGNADAHHNRGSVFLLKHEPQAALAAYDAALRVHGPRPETHIGRAHALAAMKRNAEAIVCLEQALRLNSRHDFLAGQLLQARLNICDWTDFETSRLQIAVWIAEDRRAITPLSLAAVSDSGEALLRCARVYTHAGGARVRAAPKGFPGYRHRRIRVAYVTANLGEHPVSYLMSGVLERHDVERFETIAISLQPKEESAIGLRAAQACSQFIDVSARSDAETAAVMRDLEVDIAVDLMGYTTEARTAVFAHRPAPVQVNYLGYPGTMGAPFIDYIIADEFVIPPTSRQHYAEQVVYLPECFQANDDRRVIGPSPTRADCGLPDHSVVLCCFNNTYKLNPAMFDSWCRIMHTVPDSVLWLVADDERARANLRREAGQRGVKDERLIFAARLPYPQYLGRLCLADLFLDTLPFNAGTTASDALWTGVPVLTCAGEAFAARMAGSLLCTIGMPELVTCNQTEYETIAISLARDRSRLAALKRELAMRRLKTPLFDTARFCRHLEAAYISMWERAEQGLPPDSFRVPPILAAQSTDERV